MDHIYNQPDRGGGLMSSTFVCCVPALRNRSVSYHEGMKHSNFSDSVIYQEPQSHGITMEFEPVAQRPRTAINTTPMNFGMNKRAMGHSQRTRNLSLSNLTRPWTSRGNKTKLVIGAPTDFRRLDGPMIQPRRRQFRPLELSIYSSNRLSALPDFSTDEWESVSTGLSVPKPAVVREWSVIEDDVSIHNPLHSNPISNSLRDLAHRASIVSDGIASLQNGPGPALRNSTIEMSASAVPYFDEDMPIMIPSEDIPANVPSLVATRLLTRTPSRSRSPEFNQPYSRSISDIVRPLRSSGSIRRHKPAETVDEEIRELNTIVEERRLSALRRNRDSDTLPLDHIPAIAPSMMLRTRSETLSDIGSAFSVPLTSGTPMSETSFSSPYGTPLASPPPAMTKLSKTSKVRTWFSRSSSIRETSPLTSPTSNQAFYQCEPSTTQRCSIASSTTISTSTSFLDYSDGESSPSESFPAEVNTSTTTPQSFSPTRELENDLYSPSAASINSRPSISKRNVRRFPAVPKRGISIDTTMTTSSVGTSILGVHAPPSLRAEPLPLAVGVAI